MMIYCPVNFPSKFKYFVNKNSGHFVGASMCYCITVTSWWARWRLSSPASWLFVQPFVQAQIKENIKAPRHWHMRGYSTGERWNPLTKGQWGGKCFHLMTSSWYCIIPYPWYRNNACYRINATWDYCKACSHFIWNLCCHWLKRLATKLLHHWPEGLQRRNTVLWPRFVFVRERGFYTVISGSYILVVFIEIHPFVKSGH